MTKTMQRQADLDAICAGTGKNAPIAGVILQECLTCHTAQVTDSDGQETWFVPHQAHIEKEAKKNLTWLCDSIELANAMGSTIKDLVGENPVKVDGQMVTFYDEIGINTETRLKLENLSGGRLQALGATKEAAEMTQLDWCVSCQRMEHDKCSNPDGCECAEVKHDENRLLEKSRNNSSAWLKAQMAEASKKVAHDSGDGERIFHCPFCGGGQVLGRSDGTTICDFCHTAFTVQVQPERPSMPQTINGQPVDVPGMPGQIDQAAVPEVDPNAVPQPGENPVEDQANLAEEHPLGAVPPPEFATTGARYYLTRDSVALPEESYLRHLALAHADDREGVLAQVRAENEKRA